MGSHHLSSDVRTVPASRAGEALAAGRALVLVDGVRGHGYLVCAADRCSDAFLACVARVMLDAVRLAGCAPVAAFWELDVPHGAEAAEAAAALGRRLELPVASVRSLMVERERAESAVTRVVDTAMPTADGPLTAVGYVGHRLDSEYVAFVAGTHSPAVRVLLHRRCQVSDVFGGGECGCGEQLRTALDWLHSARDGVVVYYGSDAGAPGGCGADAAPTGRAPWLFSAEVAALLRDLGLRHVVLSSNGPLAPADLEALGITVTLGAPVAAASV